MYWYSAHRLENCFQVRGIKQYKSLQLLFHQWIFYININIFSVSLYRFYIIFPGIYLQRKWAIFHEIMDVTKDGVLNDTDAKLYTDNIVRIFNFTSRTVIWYNLYAPYLSTCEQKLFIPDSTWPRTIGFHTGYRSTYSWSETRAINRHFY